MSLILVELAVAAGIFTALLVAFFAGVHLGRIRHDDQERLGVIQGATLGLVGLLLGFCFSGAMGRFIERQDIIVREANAIGTAALRADLLPIEHRNRIRTLLRTYTEQRQLLTEATVPSAGPIQARLLSLQNDLWSTAIDGVKGQPQIAMLVLSPLNDVFDLLSTRNAAANRHLPRLGLGLVFFTVLLCALVLGYGQQERSWHIRLVTTFVVLLLGAVVWVIIDLDYPQRGLIKIHTEPLQAALDSLPAPTSAP